MKRIDRLAQCKACKNRKFDPSSGLLCGLTMQKPTFEEESCPNRVSNEMTIEEKKKWNKLAKRNTIAISGLIAFFSIILIRVCFKIVYKSFLHSHREDVFLWIIAIALSAIIIILICYMLYKNRESEE